MIFLSSFVYFVCIEGQDTGGGRFRDPTEGPSALWSATDEKKEGKKKKLSQHDDDDSDLVGC